MADFKVSPSVGDEIAKGSTRYRFDGLGWSPVSRSSIAGSLAVTQIQWFYLLSAGQTLITGADLDGKTLSYSTSSQDEILVYLNGIRIRKGASQDYVLTSGSVLTLTDAGAAGDEIEIIQRARFASADYYEKSEIDTSLAGKIDDAQVLTNVPSGAVFTDTTYSHPSTHSVSEISGLQGLLDGKTTESYVDGKITDVVGAAPAALNTLQELGDALGDDANFAGSMTTALAGKVDDGQVLTNVPSGALFTDTNTVYDDTAIQAAVTLNTAKVSNVNHPLVEKAVPSNALFTDTNTTYSVGDGGLTQKNFTTADNTKLDGIEAGATVDQSKADIEGLGIAASSITGALPAISGANLTGLAASFADLTDTTISASDPTISSNPSAVGHLWINSTSGAQFVATTITAGANEWRKSGDGSEEILPILLATGGTVTDSGGYRYHQFTTSGTFQVTFIPAGTTIDYIVVGGGGGGGTGSYGLGANYNGAAGGGGGVQSASSYTPSVSSYTITVGAGGAGGSGRDAGGSNGSNSSAFGETSGYGASNSGMTGGTSGSPQSNSGGGGGAYSGGGGGGANGTGVGGGSNAKKAGGAGLQNSSFTSFGANSGYFAGGGQGSGAAGTAARALGGGGMHGTTQADLNGLASTGGGGAGHYGSNSGVGGLGGSGTVIIRYSL